MKRCEISSYKRYNLLIAEIKKLKCFFNENKFKVFLTNA